MEKNIEGESFSRLLCEEIDSCLIEDVVDDYTFIDMTRNTSGDLGVTEKDAEEDEGYLDILFEREIDFWFRRNQYMGFDNRIKCARLEEISWILETILILGFRIQTAYLSITYFDRFLSKMPIDCEKSWTVRLLSVACVSLAAKLEERGRRPLSQFQIEDYNFDNKSIQRMELLVLNTLEWRMISITPFPFLHYLIIKFCKNSPSKNIMSRTVGFIFALMREINLMDHRPSSMAAAAILMALDQSLTRQALECKINSVSYSGFLELEDVFRCYNLIQKLETKNLKQQKLVNSQVVSPTQSRP